MKTFLKILGVLVVAGVAALLAIIFVPPQLTPADKLGPVLAADWTAPKGAGEYASQMADCAACHTADGGQPFAGGREIRSPMGTIYSSNITPDAKSGIGGWTLDEFRAALVDGIGRGGVHLYPAMPYENYRKLSEADIRAMYGYFMNEVPAVDNAVEVTSLKFPFNQRWGIRLWNWMALDAPGFRAESQDETLKRGEYLVEGPGHCAACHSPRNLFMAQDGTEGSDPAFLSGGAIDNWTAHDLRGPESGPQRWSADELKRYLVSGRNAHAGVAGEMKLVVADSLQYLTNEDADAMVSYICSIGTGGAGGAKAAAVDDQKGGTVARLDAAAASGSTDATARLLTEAKPDLPLGARLYMDNCNACHFTDGRGAPNVFPALAGNSTVNAPLATGLVHAILFGAEMPSTITAPQKLRMPGFAGRLSDEEVAALATFVRSAWGNKAAAVTAADAAAERRTPSESD
ncbi:cytochrome c [Aureimonas sp. AU4]|uniref:cytochrome c n=1 Tax=Aureimonas sp. AU4 TaxID=1638163 RepID=UPI000780A0A6|nr:cytochrome c [Aureimonas sp. AU4]